METPEVKDALAGIEKLPALPTVLTQVLSAIADPEASALDLGRHIASDVTLSANLLRVVNSAFYGFFREIKSVPEAIVILGFLEVRNLVLATTAFGAFPKSASDYDVAQLWRHSLATAMAADRCAKLLQLPSDGAHFVAGLLHDFGKVALVMLYPQRYCAAVELAGKQDRHVIEVEQEVFRLDHAQVGGFLGEHWNLPESIVDAVKNHHSREFTQETSKEPCLISVADYIAHCAGLGQSGNGPAPACPEEAMNALGMSQEQCRYLVCEMQGAVPRIDALLGAMP